MAPKSKSNLKSLRRLILASASPRRRDILRQAGYIFDSLPSNSSESFDENLNINANLRRIARLKVEAAFSRLKASQRKRRILLLGADTVVISGQTKILGKPKNTDDARRMLRLLSGQVHDVRTAFCLAAFDESAKPAAPVMTRVITTKVGFRPLSQDEIEWYLSTGEPFDKAGGYGIQGLASRFVCYVKGDLLNVVGLPLKAIEDELVRQGFQLERHNLKHS